MVPLTTRHQAGPTVAVKHSTVVDSNGPLEGGEMTTYGCSEDERCVCEYSASYSYDGSCRPLDEGTGNESTRSGVNSQIWSTIRSPSFVDSDATYDREAGYQFKGYGKNKGEKKCVLIVS